MNFRKIKYSLKQFISILKSPKLIPIIKETSTDKMLIDKVALITGGSGGIGYAIAREFIDSGCKVIISGTNEEKLKKNADELKCEYIVMNLKNVKSFKDKIRQATDKYGRIDILVNSAGIHSTKSFNDFGNISEEQFDSIIEINLKGTYFISQEVSNYMIKNKIKGHILNVSSSVSEEPAWSPYRLSKLALNGFTKGIARKLIENNIIVNGIAPGSTATNLLDYKDGDSIYTEDNLLKRYIMPDEIATYARLLVSNMGDMIVGDTIFISGGRGIIDIR